MLVGISFLSNETQKVLLRFVIGTIRNAMQGILVENALLGTQKKRKLVVRIGEQIDSDESGAWLN